MLQDIQNSTLCYLKQLKHITDIEQVDTRSRFKKRDVYPSQIIDEWYEEDEVFPTRAKIPAHGLTQPSADEIDDLEIISQYDSADEDFNFGRAGFNNEIPTSSVTHVNNSSSVPVINSTHDLGETIISDPAREVASQTDLLCTSALVDSILCLHSQVPIIILLMP